MNKLRKHHRQKEKVANFVSQAHKLLVSESVARENVERLTSLLLLCLRENRAPSLDEIKSARRLELESLQDEKTEVVQP